jgi:plastocyanin
VIESPVMRAAPLLALLLTLGLAACGGSSSGSSSGSSGGSGGGSQGQASSSPCPKGAVVIHMHDIQFAPKTATAKVGDKVCWTNDDDVQHDAQADNGSFKSSLFGKGETFTTTVSKAGDVAYVCTVHPNMTATLKVKP